MEVFPLMTRRFRPAILILLCLAVIACTPAFALAQDDSEGSGTNRLSGTMPDGTEWAVEKPSGWNGTLILDLDGARNLASSASVRWMLDNGYAYGGISREPVGYHFDRAVDMLLEVRDTFIEHYGEPSRTLVWGASRGAFVGRLAMEFYPDIFDGAVVMAGGGAGEIAALNSKLDGKWILKTLVDPESPAQLVGFEDLNAETQAIQELFDKANATPEGRARIALAAAIQQFPAWVAGEEPAADDYDAQFEQLVPVFVTSQFIPGTYAMERVAGGIISWNDDADYTRMLLDSGRLDFVLAMYDKSGLGLFGLMKDLKTLEKAPRISADPDAVSRAEPILTYSGKIRGPVINIDTVSDFIDAAPGKYAYRDTLRKAGTDDLLRIVWVNRAGHVNITPLEQIAALKALEHRLDTGSWGDTSPQGMSRLAEELRAQGLDHEMNFTDYDTPDALRTWDGSNWGTYRPAR